MYGMKYLRSSTFAIISRTKVYITLILNSLFAKESVDIYLLLFSLVSFVGITLVVDSTVFGLGVQDELQPTDPQAVVEYFENTMVGMLCCFLYVLANSLSKFFETVYSRCG